MELEIIVLIATISLLFLILLRRYRKIAHLRLIKLIKGKYSFEYLNTFKTYFIRSPYPYCFRDEIIQKILFIVKDAKKFPELKSKENILFEGFTFGSNKKDLLKEKGEPYCFNAFQFEDPDFKMSVAGYKKDILGIETVIAYYFLNDKYFMGEYIFKEVSPDVKPNLLQHFLNTKSIPGDRFTIKNTMERVVNYQENGFTIDVKYLSKEDEDIMGKVAEYFDIRSHRYTANKKEVSSMIPSFYQF